MTRPRFDPSLFEALDAADVQVWRWDLATQRVRWSPGLEKLLGLAPGAFEGTFDAYLAVIPEQDRQDVVRAIRRALDEGAPYEVDHRVLVATGGTRWVTCRGHVLLDADGKTSGMAGVVWDVTARHDAEERHSAATESLRASEERFRALVENGADCILLIDEAERIVYASPAVMRMLDRDAASIVGRPVLDLVHPEDAHVPLAVRAAPNGACLDGMFRMRHLSGAWRWLEGTATNLLHDPAVRAIVSNCRDVTDRRSLEVQLQQSQKMEAIGVLAGGVAHDFNNILAIIIGFTELALRRLPPDHADAKALRESVAAAQRGAELTRKLLAFSRKQIIQLAPMDLNRAIRDVTKLLARILGEDVELAVDVGDDPLVVRADPVQIEQIVFNLCTNARQAMPDGGTVGIRVRSVSVDGAYLAANRWARAGRFAELSVTDSGVGMDTPTMARVFEPFFTTKERGTGLGLATVHGIVEQHGGAVHVESTPGAGTTFLVHVPLADAYAPVERVEDVAPAPRGGTETVLLAEDAPALRELVTTTLTELGYRVLSTGDGEEAVRVYTAQPDAIALVVLDVVMPKMGAIPAYERMRALRPGVRVLFTTGYAPESTQLAALLEAGSVQLLEKPYSWPALALAVRRAIDG
ncbi:MAG TPA: PAS domain-containing protein [Polyangiaceae bacterium]